MRKALLLAFATESVRQAWVKAWQSVGPLNTVRCMAQWREIGSRAAARARDVANLLTTPLLPDDLLGTINPVWSTTEPAGRVMEVRKETADTSTLLLRTGPRRPRHRPGQYVGVGARLEGVWHWRTYSVTSRPGDRLLAVTVTAISGGIVSTPSPTPRRWAPCSDSDHRRASSCCPSRCRRSCCSSRPAAA